MYMYIYLSFSHLDTPTHTIQSCKGPTSPPPPLTQRECFPSQTDSAPTPTVNRRQLSLSRQRDPRVPPLSPPRPELPPKRSTFPRPQRQPPVPEGGAGLAFTRHSFTSRLLCTNLPSFHSPRPPALPTLCKTIARRLSSIRPTLRPPVCIPYTIQYW